MPRIFFLFTLVVLAGCVLEKKEAPPTATQASEIVGLFSVFADSGEINRENLEASGAQVDFVYYKDLTKNRKLATAYRPRTSRGLKCAISTHSLGGGGNPAQPITRLDLGTVYVKGDDIGTTKLEKNKIGTYVAALPAALQGGFYPFSVSGVGEIKAFTRTVFLPEAFSQLQVNGNGIEPGAFIIQKSAPLRLSWLASENTESQRYIDLDILTPQGSEYRNLHCEIPEAEIPWNTGVREWTVPVDQLTGLWASPGAAFILRRTTQLYPTTYVNEPPTAVTGARSFYANALVAE